MYLLIRLQKKEKKNNANFGWNQFSFNQSSD